MFRCAVCGSTGLKGGTCGVCGGVVHEIREDSSWPLAVPASIVRTGNMARHRFRPFKTWTSIGASMIVVIVALSSVGAGLYLYARPSAPSCSNGGLNYPSCNSCVSSEMYNSSTDSCQCANTITVMTLGGPSTRQAVNPPACNRFCANNAINPPNCDMCPDNHTDIVCPPGLPPETDTAVKNDRLGYPRS
jgi:hypothetical protein